MALHQKIYNHRITEPGGFTELSLVSLLRDASRNKDTRKDIETKMSRHAINPKLRLHPSTLPEGFPAKSECYKNQKSRSKLEKCLNLIQRGRQ
jgi:hypothetical protein